MKDLSNIIRTFEKLYYKCYERRRPKHEPTDSYFYLARQLVKFIMRADSINLQVDPVRTEVTDEKQTLILHVCSMDDIKSKEFLVDKQLSRVYSTDYGKLESIIADESST